MLIQNINPVMLEIANLPIVGTISLRYYGVLYALGIITAFLICRSFFRKNDDGDDNLFNQPDRGEPTSIEEFTTTFFIPDEQG